MKIRRNSTTDRRSDSPRSMRAALLGSLFLGSLLVGSGMLSGCATTHVLEWTNERPSTFGQPQRAKSVYVRAGGTVLALPVAFTWDVATMPFQWIWGVYPYGEQNAPSEFQGK